MLERNKLLTIFIIAIISFNSCSQTKHNKNQIVYEKLESEIDSLMDEPKHSDFRGSVLISRNDKILYDKSYGDKISNSNTAFWIGSMTKSFTAAAILKLQEGNRLSVKDSISKFIDNVPMDKMGITIHHLLTHSSGLANNYIADGIIERAAATNLILSAKLEYAIGEKYYYSAEGYNLLAIIIENVSGESYESYISKNLLAQLNLGHTGFWGLEDNVKIKLAPWNNPDLMNNFSRNIIYEGLSQSNYGYKGGTGIFSTTENLNTWTKALKNNKVLNSENLHLMFKPYVSARGDMQNGVFYGYGWFLEYNNRALREIRHMGAEAGGIGHNGIIRTYENGYKVIVLSNSGVYQGEGRLNGVEWGIVLSFDLRDIVETK